MSNFMKVGRRQELRDKTKRNIKGITKIIKELNRIALSIYFNKEDYNEDNIVEIASKYSNLKIERLEKTLLLSKLNNIHEQLRTKANTTNTKV